MRYSTECISTLLTKSAKGHLRCRRCIYFYIKLFFIKNLFIFTYFVRFHFKHFSFLLHFLRLHPNVAFICKRKFHHKDIQHQKFIYLCCSIPFFLPLVDFWKCKTFPKKKASTNSMREIISAFIQKTRNFCPLAMQTCDEKYVRK